LISAKNLVDLSSISEVRSYITEWPRFFWATLYSFNVKLTSATFNNASTRYIISPKACKQKHLIVSPKAKNNFNKTYFQKLSLQTEQMGGFVAKNTKKQANKSSIVIGLLANDCRL